MYFFFILPVTEPDASLGPDNRNIIPPSLPFHPQRPLGLAPGLLPLVRRSQKRQL